MGMVACVGLEHMTFNRIIKSGLWPDGLQGEFEYPKERLPQGWQGQLALLATYPSLFMLEGRDTEGLAHVGSAQIIREGQKTVTVRYAYDPLVPAIPQARLVEIASVLELSTTGRGWDWNSTVWSVHSDDLYRAVYRLTAHSRNAPTVFRFASPPKIDATLVSAMMPFAGAFDGVYAAIRAAAATVGLRSQRADDIFVHERVIDDIIALIDQSRIVVCDLSNRNPNVFYETGIVHSLGRQFILIAQHESDVPFDLRHLRYIPYLNNAQGHSELVTALTDRMNTILAASPSA